MLVLAMSQRESVKHGEISKLTPDVAAEYAGKTPKTVARDLNQLITMGLVRRRANSYQANREIVLTFLPTRRKNDNDR